MERVHVNFFFYKKDNTNQFNAGKKRDKFTRRLLILREHIVVLKRYPKRYARIGLQSKIISS